MHFHQARAAQQSGSLGAVIVAAWADVILISCILQGMQLFDAPSGTAGRGWRQRGRLRRPGCRRRRPGSPCWQSAGRHPAHTRHQGDLKCFLQCPQQAHCLQQCRRQQQERRLDTDQKRGSLHQHDAHSLPALRHSRLSEKCPRNLMYR